MFNRRMLRFTTTFSFAIKDYNMRAWWFGTIILLQQLLTAMFIAFLRFHETAQLACTIGVYVIFAILIWIVSPFEEKHINRIQLVCYMPMLHPFHLSLHHSRLQLFAPYL